MSGMEELIAARRQQIAQEQAQQAQQQQVAEQVKEQVSQQQGQDQGFPDQAPTEFGQQVLDAQSKPAAPVTIDGQPMDEFVKQERQAQGLDQGNSTMQELLDARKAQLQQERRDKPVVDNAQITDNEPGLGSDLLRRTGGAIEVAGTIVSGALHEVPAGLNGMWKLFTSGGDMDAAAAAIQSTRDAWSFSPVTDTGKEMLNGAIAPLQKLDDVADKIASTVGMGNPYAETLIYSSIVGGLSIAGLKAGSAIKVPVKVRNIKKVAERLGIETTQDGIATSLWRAAADMVPTTRAANASALRQALRDARKADKAKIEVLRETSSRARAFVSVAEAGKFAQGAAKELIDSGFKLNKLPRTMELINDLANLANKSPASLKSRNNVAVTSRIQDIQLVINRMDRLRKRAKGDEKASLNSLKRKTEDWLDDQFNTDMISGKTQAINEWKAFRNSSKEFKANFKKDRTIVQLMNKNATPETLLKWLLGATKTGAKTEAATIVNRVKGLLGKDHPTIRGIQQDFLFEVASPLLQDIPNFRGFINNWTTMVRNNPSLVKSLGLKMTDMAALVKFARTAEKVHAPVPFTILGQDAVSAAARYGAGHGIAKAGVRVKVISNILKLLLGKTKVKQKAILYDLAGVKPGGTFMDKRSRAAGRAIQAVAAADIPGLAEDE